MIRHLLSWLAAAGSLFLRPKFLAVFVLPNVLFVALDALTDDATLIVTLNLMLMSLAIGVVAAYVPSAIAYTAKDGKADSADYLTVGIAVGFWGTVWITGYTALYRWLGMPTSMRNSDAIAYARFCLSFAAVCHLAAPGAIKQSVPPRRWLFIGIIAAASVFLALLTLRVTDPSFLNDLPFGLGGVLDLPRSGRVWER